MGRAAAHNEKRQELRLDAERALIAAAPSFPFLCAWLNLRSAAQVNEAYAACQ